MSTTFNYGAVLAALRTVLPHGAKALHEPTIGTPERRLVQQCLDSGWVSSEGPFVRQFEEWLARFTSRHVVATASGTAALHMCFKLVGVEPGDEVLVPALTFVATANAVSYCGATPHFVDSNPATLGMDVVKLRRYLGEIAVIRDGACYNRHTGARIRAVCPVHTFGHPMDGGELLLLCLNEYPLRMVEDAAESLGSFSQDGWQTGTLGDVAAISFNGNKIVTTGGGGAILTHDPKLAALAKHLTTTAKATHKWAFEHDAVGYNYRMPNINAALGCAQLERLAAAMAAKRTLAAKYIAALSSVPGVQPFEEPPGARSNYWLNALLLDEAICDQRDSILDKLNADGIAARPVWRLMHRLPMYKDCPRMDLSCAEDLERRIINLPSSASL